jgi:phenylalanyl-tRNA synthetase beta chain
VVNGTGSDGLCVEEKHLGAVLYSKATDEKTIYLKGVEIVNCLASLIKQKSVQYEKIAVRHNWQHPKNTASISIDGKEVGVINALYPTNRVKIDKNAAVVCIEINMDAFTALSASAVQFEEPSVQQATYYDLSLVVPENVRYSQIEKAWSDLSIAELESVKLIDLFDRANIKSITLRFNFSSHERTLGMEEVQAWIDSIVANLGTIGVALRA